MGFEERILENPQQEYLKAFRSLRRSHGTGRSQGYNWSLRRALWLDKLEGNLQMNLKVPFLTICTSSSWQPLSFPYQQGIANLTNVGQQSGAQMQCIQSSYHQTILVGLNDGFIFSDWLITILNIIQSCICGLWRCSILNETIPVEEFPISWTH